MKFFFVVLLVGACLTVSWPSATKTITYFSPIIVKARQTFDGFKENENKYPRCRKNLGDCRNIEGGKADVIFLLYKGATLKNVILDAKSVEYIHCEEDWYNDKNVYWEDIYEDALTFENAKSTSAKLYSKGGATWNGNDKIIQHNSVGTVYISNFYSENSGKLYIAWCNWKKGY